LGATWSPSQSSPAGISRNTPRCSPERSRWISESATAGGRVNPTCCFRSGCADFPSPNGTAPALWSIYSAPSSKSPRQIPCCAGRLCQRHIVDARGSPRLTSQQPRQSHPSAAPEAEALDSFVGVCRTGWKVAAIVTDQRRQRVPIDPDHRAPRVARQPRCAPCAVHAIV
jgi:hypothetical protein